jgi:hypothetical protein
MKLEITMETVIETVRFTNARELFLALMNVPNLENVGIEQHDARDVHAFELVQRTLPDQSTQAHIRFLPFVAPLQTEPGCQLCGSGFLTTQSGGGVICDACGHEQSIRTFCKERCAECSHTCSLPGNHGGPHKFWNDQCYSSSTTEIDREG